MGAFPEQPDDVLAIHSWGKPVHRGAATVGYVTVCDRGWGAFDVGGNLISTHKIEHHAVRAVQAQADRLVREWTPGCGPLRPRAVRKT